MSELDKAEHETIARLVADIERKQADPHVATGTRIQLGEYLDHMKKRMNVLEQDGAVFDERGKKDNAAKMDAAIVAMVERETRLSASEKQAYGEFLEKEYFTRKDLGGLEQFYANGGAWDRLSEKGKEQMGKRLEEGIRRGEIEFSELSPNMQKKHSDWIYGQLSQGKDAGGKFASMSAEDRAAFMREHEAGNYGAAREVLTNKDSFDYQLVDNQAASERSAEAAASGTEGSKKSDSQKAGAEKASDSDQEILASIGKNPLELDTALSGNSIERS